jgi:hypothetical protein
VVKIVETRPLSKDKNWRIVEIIRKADIVGALKDDVETGKPGEPK